MAHKRHDGSETYAARNDGTLSCAISTKPEDAGTSIMGFFQEHMVVILNPINEHITDLYRKNGEVHRHLTATDKAVERLVERLDLHDLDLAGGHVKHSKLETDFKGLEVLLKEDNTIEHVHDMEAEMRKLGKARTAVEERLERTLSAIEAMQAGVDASYAEIHRVELKLMQTTSLAMKLEGIIPELRQEDANIHDRHLGLCRGVENLNAINENTRFASIKATNDMIASEKRVGKAMKVCEDRVAGVEDKCEATRARVERDEPLMTRMGEALGEIRGEMCQMHEELHHLEEENVKSHEQAGLQAEEQAKLEAKRAEELKKNMSVLERVKEGEAVLATFRKTVTQELQKNIPEKMREMHDATQRLGDDITQNTGAIKNLETVQPMLDERIVIVEKRMKDSETLAADLVKRTELAREDISELSMFCKKAEDRMDNHTVELEKGEAFSRQTREALGQTNAQVQHVYGEVGDAKGGLEKTSMKLELAHEYIQGMTRGLQETHKLSLAGNDGMLTAKTGFSRSRPLPMIGSAESPEMRPNSAGQRSKTAAQATPQSPEMVAQATAVPAASWENFHEASKK